MLWWTIRQLKSDDSTSRARAVEKLSNSRDQRTVDSVIGLLTDPSPTVRRLAAEILARVSDARAVDALMTTLKDANVSVREEVVKALGCIGEMRAVEALIAALKDNNGGVRKKAAGALSRIKDPRAIDSLLGCLKDEDPHMREISAGALKSIGWTPTDNNQKAQYAGALKHWDELEKMGPASVETLFLLLKDEDKDSKKLAAKVLGKVADVGAVEPLSMLIKSKDQDAQIAAVRALGNIRDARAVDALISELRPTYHDSTVLDAIIDSLVKLGSLAVVPLVDVLNGNRKDSIPLAAVRALGRIRDERAFEALIAALKNQSISPAAAEALGKTRDERAIGPLIAAINDNAGAPTSRAAAQALEKFPHKSEEMKAVLSAYRREQKEQGKTDWEQKKQNFLKLRERLAEEMRQPKPKIERAKRGGSRQCERCEAALQWWSRNMMRRAGMNITTLSGRPSSIEPPSDFAGACKSCRDGFCKQHAANDRCPKCGGSLIS